VEPAGALLTRFLRPAELTLYTEEKRIEIMKGLRLLPEDKGNVKLFQKFWRDDGKLKNMMPPLLVYVDLMNTGERRCIETAQKIYDEYLQIKF
jgi:hypothetical protein